MDRRCPDCSVTMTKTKPTTSMEGERLQLKTDQKKDGLLGSLGAKKTLPTYAYLCAECGLVRLYVEDE